MLKISSLNPQSKIKQFISKCLWSW